MSSPNYGGINSFSGPMGEKEPAYGTAENMKILSKIGVEPPASQNAAKQSQRRATGKSKKQPKPPPGQTLQPQGPPQISGEQAPVANYGQQLAQFWSSLAATPGASPLVQQIAAQAVSGA